MIISLEEFKERVDSPKNLINIPVDREPEPTLVEKSELEIRDLYNGGGAQVPLPPAIKQLVAVEAHFRGSAAVAADYGLHPSSVNNIKHGLRGKDTGSVRVRDE